MATTIIAPCPPLKDNLSEQQMLEAAYEGYRANTADMDKAGDIPSHEYYAGAADAYREVVRCLSGIDLETERQKL